MVLVAKIRRKLNRLDITGNVSKQTRHLDENGFVIPRSQGTKLKRNPSSPLALIDDGAISRGASREDEQQAIVAFIDEYGITHCHPGKSRGAYQDDPKPSGTVLLRHITKLKGGARFMGKEFVQRNCTRCGFRMVTQEDKCSRCRFPTNQKASKEDMQAWKDKQERKRKEESEVISLGNMNEKTKQRRMEKMAKKKVATKKKSGGGPGKRIDCMGHGVCGMLRWMGAKGYSVDQARAAMKSLKCKPSESTLKQAIVQGASGSHEPESLTQKETAEFKKHIPAKVKKVSAVPKKKTAVKKKAAIKKKVVKKKVAKRKVS